MHDVGKFYFSMFPILWVNHATPPSTTMIWPFSRSPADVARRRSHELRRAAAGLFQLLRYGLRLGLRSLTVSERWMDRWMDWENFSGKEIPRKS